MRNWAREVRKTVEFSCDMLQAAELDWERSKQLVPSGCGSNRVYHGSLDSISSANTCATRRGDGVGGRGQGAGKNQQ